MIRLDTWSLFVSSSVAVAARNGSHRWKWMAEGAAANSGDDSGTLLRDCDVCSDSDTSDTIGGGALEPPAVLLPRSVDD